MMNLRECFSTVYVPRDHDDALYRSLSQTQDKRVCKWDVRMSLFASCNRSWDRYVQI